MSKTMNTQKIHEIQVNNWLVRVKGEIVKLPSEPFVEFGEEVLGDWVRAWFDRPPSTYVEKKIGVPSIFVRVDGVLRKEEEKLKLFPFEVEERPAGIGLSLVIHKLFGCSEVEAVVSQARKKFDFIGVESPRRQKTHDDTLWIKVYSPQEWEKCGKPLLWPRIDPDEEGYYGLEEYALSSVRRKGQKTYGEILGWWKKVFTEDHLPWGESFVLKPPQGSKLANVLIWDRRKRTGSVTRAKIRETMSRFSFMYLQPFVELMDPPYTMLRIFYVWKKGKYHLGWGLSFTRPNIRIHGASDSTISIVQFI